MKTDSMEEPLTLTLPSDLWAKLCYFPPLVCLVKLVYVLPIIDIHKHVFNDHINKPLHKFYHVSFSGYKS